MAAANAVRKAEDFEKQAEKRLNGWALFNKQAKFDDAAGLYKNAANQYKVAKEWEAAGRAYEKAGVNAELAGNPAEAMMYYSDAGKAFKQEDVKEAVRVLGRALELQRDSGKSANAAKTLKLIGELHEEDMNAEAAIRAYKEAADVFQAEGSASHANNLLLKAADLHAMADQYGDAIGLYQKVGEASLANALTKWSVTDYYFKAAICSLVQETQQSTECKATEAAIDNYVDSHPPFQTSREYALLKKLVEAVSAGDVQEFTDALFEYNQISPLDNFKSSLLVKVKRRMIEADNDIGEGAAAAADEDVPDFT